MLRKFGEVHGFSRNRKGERFSQRGIHVFDKSSEKVILKFHIRDSETYDEGEDPAENLVDCRRQLRVNYVFEVNQASTELHCVVDIGHFELREVL